MQIRYSRRHVPTVKRFMESSAFIRGLLGPFGSGKSSGCVIELIKRGQEQKPGPDGIRRTRFAVIRNTYVQLKDTTINTFHQWFPPHIFGEYKHAEHKYVIKAFENVEIEILFRALDRPDQVSNLLSLELTGAWVNEAREVPWPIIEALQGRVGRFPAQRDGGPTWFGIIMDTNPPDADSKWYEFFEEKNLKPEFAQIFKQPSGLSDQAENLDNLPGGRKYYTNLCEGKSEEWIKVYVRGEYGFVIDGRPVFPEYEDSVHCKECKTVPYEPIYRGWDFGLTPACVFAQLTPSGQLLVVDEMTSDSMGIEKFSDDVIMHTSMNFPDREFIDVGDPAGMQRSQTDEKTCFQILQSKGIDIEPGLQTLAIRLESVRKPLTTMIAGKPGFVLHPRCRVLRKGFQGLYQFRRMQTSAERYTDQPDKNAASHPMDALEYPCTVIFGRGLTLPRGAGIKPREDDYVFQTRDVSATGY